MMWKRPLTKKQEEDIVSSYEKGSSILAMAKKYGRGWQSIYGLLKRNKVYIRPRGGARKKIDDDKEPKKKVKMYRDYLAEEKAKNNKLKK